MADSPVSSEASSSQGRGSPQLKIKDEKSSVTASAIVVAIGILLSRILGLARDVMTARYFPTDTRDAFLAAFRLPNLFRRIFGEGSLSVSFIPIFVGILAGRSKTPTTDVGARAHHLVSVTFSILTTVVVTSSLLAIVFMEDIILFLLRGNAYASVPGKLELTIELARIMFGFVVLVSLYAFFMAILNSLRRFATAALAPCLLNISMIAAAWVSGRMGADAKILAIAVLIGGFLQMAALIPEVVKSGFFPRFVFNWNNDDVWLMVKRLFPSMLGLSVMQLTALVNMSFASYLPGGSLSYLYFADRILEFPLSLVVVSVGSALLPTLAKYAAEGNRDAMGETINHYIRLILFIALPAALGMFVLAQPITEVLFLRGEFKYTDALATAEVIRIYSVSVILASGVRILAQGFYATQNTWYPAVAAAVALCSHVIFAYVFTRAFRLEGLAAASVASAFVNLMMLGAAYNSWVGSLQLKKLFISFLKFAACGLVMVFALQLYPGFRHFLSGRIPFSRAIALCSMIGFAGGIYLLMAYIFRIAEFRETIAGVKEKIRVKRA